MKIVFCGGHHNCALVLAEKLRERGDEIFWFGHKFSTLENKNPSAEYLEVTRGGFPFIEIKAGKFQPRYKFWQNFIRIPLGFYQSFQALKKIRPDLIFSFGGYLALPVVYSGFLQQIPVFTHEQTVTAGFANRLIAKVARKVFVTFEESIKHFPPKKVIYSGMPLRREILKSEKLIINNKKLTIYVTGGKQGSHKINEAIFQIFPEILKRFNLIHQCGSNTLHNDFIRAKALKERLGKLGKDYIVKEYFFAGEIGSILHSSDFVISRAGAHTVYELLSLRKPAILIPIPWSSNKEQLKNAQMLQKIGLAVILSEDELQKGKLWETIQRFSENLGQYKIKEKLKFVEDPVTKIISQIDELIA